MADVDVGSHRFKGGCVSGNHQIRAELDLGHKGTLL